MGYERIIVCNRNERPQPTRGVIQLTLPLVLVFLMVCSCSFMVDPDRVQCSRKEDCEQRGEDFSKSKCVDFFCRKEEPWDCLGKVKWPDSTSGTVNVVLNLADLVKGQPVSGLSAQVCNKLDTTCASPLVTDLVSDSSGRLTFSIQSGFDGYLESTAGGIMPFLYFFYPPVTSDRDVAWVPILQAAQLATFATMAGGNVMPDRGHLLARAYDCFEKYAEGVSFSSPEGDSSTTPFYMIKGIPSTKHSETDSSGNGGLLNLPPGTATLTGQLKDGRTMGMLSAMTKPGRMTLTALVPAPK
jgi:hypothetical protein